MTALAVSLRSDPALAVFGPVALLFVLPFLAYWHALWKGGWVSDDCAFSTPEAKAMAYYEGVLQKPFSWGTVIKYLRFWAACVPNPNPDWKEKKQPAFISFPRAHHRLNVWLSGGVNGLAYLLFSHLFDPHLAFLAVLLFAVHPLGTQTIAWVSGINYLLGAFFVLLSLNIALLFPGLSLASSSTVLILGLFALSFWMAGLSIFQMSPGVLILYFLKAWPFAILATLFCAFQAYQTITEAIRLRKKTFKEQQMGDSTKIHGKKTIFMAKLLYYNAKLALFPKRLGLYSDYFYHYEPVYAESEDRFFWKGFAVFVAGLTLFVLGPPPVQLGLIWFVTFIAIFSGLMVANQVVVDRYVWFPCLGICLILAAVLPSWLFLIVVGIFLMRTWAQLPAYDNEENFYQSNVWNFPTSEVAYGNLGVQYQAQGRVMAAMAAWIRGTELNVDYDVCWYNLHSMFLSRGPIHPNYLPEFFLKFPPAVQEQAFQKDLNRSHLHVARYCLERAVTARQCHFPGKWKEEKLALDRELSRPFGAPPPVAPLIRPLPLAGVAIT